MSDNYLGRFVTRNRRRDRNAGCASGRTTRVRLIPLVAAERRQALDASARLWAGQLPAVPKNQ